MGVNGVIGLYVGITMNSKPETENVTLQHPLMVEKIVMEKKLNKKNAHLKLLPSMEDLVNGVHGLNVHQNRRTAQMMNSKPETGSVTIQYPQMAEKNCDALGPKTEEKECPPKAIDGGFSAWSEWTKCGAEDKVQSRNRECNNPKPNFGGKNCDALGKKMEEKECPKPPTWTPWTPWTDCSVTCGSGTQSRSRTCPVKDACPGLPSETKGCEKDACDSVVRCPKDMTYLDAKQFCASRGMKLPRPYSMAENERMTKLGATWMEVIVNEIFGLDERFENWKGRQRGFLCPDGKWKVLGPMDLRPCHCVSDVSDSTQCSDVFHNNPSLLNIHNGEWQFKRDDRSYYGPFTRHSLDEIQLGSKLQYKCKGKKQCRGFVCVRTGDGNSAFVR